MTTGAPLALLTNESSVGVIGAGAMGSGIAQLAASYGHNVALADITSTALQRARGAIEKNLKGQVEKGRIEEAQARSILGRITFTEEINTCAICPIVIEAVIEDLALKQELFKRLDEVASADTILATNTSSLSVASIASACKKKQSRVLGLHFFNPPMVLPLVEIIPSLSTDPRVVDTTKALVTGWGKTAVVARDLPGFIVNRIARPFYGEALRIFEEGMADRATIDWAMREIGGFKMGPFELMDFIGNDINYKVSESVFEAFYYDPRYRPSITQKRLVESGRLGRKTLQGHYCYKPDAPGPAPKQDETLGKEIFMRILAMLINEAVDAVFMQVASPADIDLAMVKGVNYPKGLLKWADEIGLKKILNKLESLQEEYGEDRYRASALMKRMTKKPQKFFS
ncbi:MAG: 3-hydroxybutyryl-CoA dehydrogenase [Oligoflexia bacterium]|nr:3-hydroxybutyryl-CoA dehydrogenase [Oligoflexia bacterium]